MRSRTATRSAAIATILAMLALLSTASFAFAKDGGIVTLAEPIPLDAEPGSTLTVEFDAMMLTQDGLRPIDGAKMVLRLTGPDGAVTEAIGTDLGRAGTYVAEIVVPAGGVDRADFGLHRATIGTGGSSMVEDIPFDVDGVLFAMTRDPAPNVAAVTASPAPDVRPMLAAVVLGALAVVGIGLALAAGRRRSLRSA